MEHLICQKMPLKEVINIIILIILLCSFNSCRNEVNLKNSDEKFGIDSVFYKLSEPSKLELEKLIGEDSIQILALIPNFDENEIKIVFIFNEKKIYSGERIKFILKHSNRYLKTERHVFKVLLKEDEYFVDKSKDSLEYIRHYPTAGIKVNSRGELLDSYSERYRLKK